MKLDFFSGKYVPVFRDLGDLRGVCLDTSITKPSCIIITPRCPHEISLEVNSITGNGDMVEAYNQISAALFSMFLFLMC